MPNTVVSIFNTDLQSNAVFTQKHMMHEGIRLMPEENWPPGFSQGSFFPPLLSLMDFWFYAIAGIGLLIWGLKNKQYSENIIDLTVLTLSDENKI